MKKLTRNLMIAGISILTGGAIAAGLICYANIKKPDVIVNGQVKYEYSESLGGWVAVGLSNADLTKITSIKVSEKYQGGDVVAIEKGAFSGCTNLQSITLPFIGWQKDSTKIDPTEALFGYIFGSEIISGQGGITWQQYIDGDGNTQYAKYAIPKSLTSVTITNAETIPAGAFSCCSYLETITINKDSNSNGVSTIGNMAFYGCTSLFEFDFSTLSGLDTIETSAFENCYVLNKIDIPSGVKMIQDSAFKNCISSSTAKIPLSVVTMGKNAFQNHIGGIIMVEGSETETSKSAAWDNEWTDSSSSIVYDFKSTNSYAYADDWLTIICGSEGNQYGYLAQWMGSWEQTTITIPSKITYQGKDIPVKAIGGKCFNENYFIQNLVFEEGVEVIYPNTFQGCTALKYVNFPESLKEIRAEAFEGCTSLIGYLDNGTPTNNLHFTQCTNLTLIGDKAFKNCSGLTDIKFSNTIEEIGAEAFAHCYHLCCDNTSDPDYALHLPENCTKLGQGAFKYSFKYAPDGYSSSYYYPTIILGENITTIPENCFERCGVRNLKPTTGEDIGTVYPKYVRVNIDLNNAKIQYICDYAFNDCWICNLRNARNTHIEYIGDYAFYYAQPTSSTEGSPTGKQDLQMDQEIKYIGDYAFAGCSTIKSLTFNTAIDSADGTTNEIGYNSLEHLGQCAFRWCSNSEFTEVDLSPCINLVTECTDDNIKYPEKTPRYAFGGCTYLQKVRFPGHKPINAEEQAELSTHPWWSVDSSQIKFHEVPERMFESCSLGNDGDRTPIYVPENVTAIRNYAFYDNKTLQEVYIQGSIDYFGTGVFQNDESLLYVRKLKSYSPLEYEDVTFNSSRLLRGRIGSNIYNGCIKLMIAPLPIPKEDEIPSTYYYDINSNMYLNNVAMTEFTVPKAIRTISTSAFQGCTNLAKVNVDETNTWLTRIENYCFNNCVNLAEFNISKTNLSYIGNYAFNNCIELGKTKDFMLPNNAITMGITPFEGWDDSNQTIKFRNNNCKVYDTGTSKWVIPDDPTAYDKVYLNGMESNTTQWILTRNGSEADGYYWTCDVCGNKDLKFIYVAE